MVRTIIWFTYFWLYLVALIPAMFYVTYLIRSGKAKEATELIEKLVVNWAKRLIALAGGKILVQGYENLPKNMNFVAVSNHQGDFDIPIMLSYTGAMRPLLSKKELSKLPFLAWWMKTMGCFFLDRKKPSEGAKAMLAVIKSLKEGKSITIFPEGTRSRSGTIARFKEGAFAVAKKANVPLVPITIDGSYKLMGRRGMIISPAEVHVTIHEAIMPEDQGENISEVVKTMIENQLKGE